MHFVARCFRYPFACLAKIGAKRGGIATAALVHRGSHGIAGKATTAASVQQNTQALGIDNVFSGIGCIHRIKETIYNSVVGHEEVKEGLMLALLAREHAYIEGPPGTGKTFLAELLSQSAGLRFFFYQFHRDTRLNELIGDSVLVRSFDEKLGGEVVRLVNKPGGILKAQICVLDDISRAPGEALNVLLRLLNERTYEDKHIPLMSAIATGNPATDEFYNEPLDPANLDRFTVQIKMPGLVEGHCWKEALQLMDLYEGARREELLPSPGTVSEQKQVDAAMNTSEMETRLVDMDIMYRDVMNVTISTRVKKLLLHLLDTLIKESKQVASISYGSSGTLMSDRTFLVKSLKILKAKALYHGRKEVIESDLHAIKFLTTLRIPESVHACVPDIVDTLISKWLDEEANVPSQSRNYTFFKEVKPHNDAAAIKAQPARIMRDGTVFQPGKARAALKASPSDSDAKDPTLSAWEQWNQRKVASGAAHLHKRLTENMDSEQDSKSTSKPKAVVELPDDFQNPHNKDIDVKSQSLPTMEEVFANACYGTRLRQQRASPISR